MKDVNFFEKLSNKALLVDDVLVNRYVKSCIEVSMSFFEILNEDEEFLVVADKKHHRFIPMFRESLNHEMSIYILLQHETYSDSKYVYALIFKRDKCVNSKLIYCNSKIYKPLYDKNFGALVKGDTIRLFEMKNGFFGAFNIIENGFFSEEISTKKYYNKSIYNSLFELKSNNDTAILSKVSEMNYEVLFPLSKVNIRTHNVIPLPRGIFTKSFESYFILKETKEKITKMYYLNKCLLTNGKYKNTVIKEVYKGNKNIEINTR